MLHVGISNVFVIRNRKMNQVLRSKAPLVLNNGADFMTDNVLYDIGVCT